LVGYGAMATEREALAEEYSDHVCLRRVLRCSDGGSKVDNGYGY